MALKIRLSFRFPQERSSPVHIPILANPIFWPLFLSWWGPQGGGPKFRAFFSLSRHSFFIFPSLFVHGILVALTVVGSLLLVVVRCWLVGWLVGWCLLVCLFVCSFVCWFVCSWVGGVGGCQTKHVRAMQLIQVAEHPGSKLPTSPLPRPNPGVPVYTAQKGFPITP